MNNGGEVADQVVRYALEGSEIALRITGAAAKNLAMLLIAVLKDQKKTRGRTHLIRMAKEQRPMRFFDVPTDRLKEFAQYARRYGVLFVAFRDKQAPGSHEIMVFADDAAKVSRIIDKMHLDAVEIGQMDTEVINKEKVSTQTVETKEGKVTFVVEEEFDDILSSSKSEGGNENFTLEEPEVGNPSGASSPSKATSPAMEVRTDVDTRSTESKHFLKDEELPLEKKEKPLPVTQPHDDTLPPSPPVIKKKKSKESPLPSEQSPNIIEVEFRDLETKPSVRKELLEIQHDLNAKRALPAKVPVKSPQQTKGR